MQRMLDFEAASALSKGERSYQEDAVISDFAQGCDVGLIVLADGMGGHAAGDVASKIVVTEVFSELTFQRGETDVFEEKVTSCLYNAAMAANACLKDHVSAFPDTRGMGATLVACVLIENRLYWISIGDSPLYLFRDGRLVQLNEDHSMAPQIDFMIKSGLIDAEEGACHPDRNTLTSVLFGEAVPRIDCPKEAMALQDRDILIVASDGLQFLTNQQIESSLDRNQHRSSSEIAGTLLNEVKSLEDPDLDNVSFALVKLQDPALSRVLDDNSKVRSDFRRVG